MNLSTDPGILRRCIERAAEFYNKPDNNFWDVTGMNTAQVDKARAVSACSVLSEAERHSLVKRSKSPTPNKHAGSERDLSIYEPIKEIDELAPVFAANAPGPGKFTMIQYREWSDEYRVRTRVETSLSKPPLNEGARYSNLLSHRGARKITESCYYIAAKHGGFKTFVTGTFDREVRAKIASGKTTIQREVSRTMDAMQKMYQRGWQTKEGSQVEGNDNALAYCWVVEIPKNEAGEDNPHVHMMLNWRVKYQLFEEWSQRIESFWGNGWFRLEKIKDPLCAGAYMAKAAGYMTKGAKQDDQGRVKGNRYGISKNARAPDWYTVKETELGVMGRLITEMHETCQEKYGAIYAERNELKKILDKCPKEHKAMREKIGKKLQSVRERILKIPIVSSKYQLIFKGSKIFSWFMGWSIGAGWKLNNRPGSRWLEIFNQRLESRKNQRAIQRQRWGDIEWMYAVRDYSQSQYFESGECNTEEWTNYSMGACA